MLLLCFAGGQSEALRGKDEVAGSVAASWEPRLVLKLSVCRPLSQSLATPVWPVRTAPLSLILRCRFINPPAA